ncbi:nuclear polyadenylated RNA-binding protein 3 [Saitoella coloradoensis]
MDVTDETTIQLQPSLQRGSEPAVEQVSSPAASSDFASADEDVSEDVPETVTAPAPAQSSAVELESEESDDDSSPGSDYDPEASLNLPTVDSNNNSATAPVPEATASITTASADSTNLNNSAVAPAVATAESTSAPPSALPATGIPSSVDLQSLLANISALPTTAPAPAVKPSQSPSATYRSPVQHNSAPSNDRRRTRSPQPDKSQLTALYDKFLADEQHIMGSMYPDQMPPNARMFIGNLPDGTTKWELFTKFYKYGRMAQISIKPSYGFIQFLSGEDCKAAIEGEDGTSIHGKKLHLEVSKPPRPREEREREKKEKERPRYDGRDRSISPRGRAPGRMAGAGNYGGYNHNARSPPRYGRSSRSPPRYRDERDRDRDYYDRRPRSPPRRGYRSPSPPRGGPQFPLPRRHGRDVPEVQILALDEADRNFVKFVDAAFAAQFRTHTLSLSPRLPVDEVIRQMVVEGVDAVVILNRNLQYRNKISLQCFDRRGGANVKFEEYADVDINVGVALVQRLKQAAVAAHPAMAMQPAGYGMPPPVGIGYPPVAAPPPAAAAAAAPGANLASIISSLDPAALQNVIGALAKAQQPGAAPVAPPGYPSAGLPAGFAMPGYPGAGAPGPAPPAQGAPTQQVQDIMAQLARLQGRQ